MLQLASRLWGAGPAGRALLVAALMVAALPQEQGWVGTSSQAAVCCALIEYLTLQQFLFSLYVWPVHWTIRAAGKRLLFKLAERPGQ